MVKAVLWRSCVSSFTWQDERSKKKKKGKKENADSDFLSGFGHMGR